jgi:hypothetical protein
VESGADAEAHAREDIPALLEALEDALARSRQAAADEDWLDRVPEPWASVLRAEIYSRSRKARHILDAAAGDEEGHRRAREKVREMGLDPDGAPTRSGRRPTTRSASGKRRSSPGCPRPSATSGRRASPSRSAEHQRAQVRLLSPSQAVSTNNT